MLQSFTLGALAFMHHAPLVAFYVTALAGGCMLAFDNPVRRSFVPEMVPEGEVQNAVTLNSALMTSARIFGPALGGVLVVTAGYGWAFVIDAITYLAVIGAIADDAHADLSQPPRTLRARGQIRDGLRYVHSVPDLWVPLVMMTIVGTLTFNFSVVLPLFAERTLHGSDTTYTLLYSVLSVGSLGGALITAHRRSITITHLVVASVAFGVAMLALAAHPAPRPPRSRVAVLVGLTSIAFMASSTAIVQVRADPAMRGGVLALQAMVFIGSTPIGGPILGAICDRYGARSGLVIGGVAALATGVYGWAARHSRRPRRPDRCPRAPPPSPSTTSTTPTRSSSRDPGAGRSPTLSRWSASSYPLARSCSAPLASGPADGRLVILLHGFPQSAGEWRAQLGALGAAGYRGFAPDQRGYSPGARPGESRPTASTPW